MQADINDIPDELPADAGPKQGSKVRFLTLEDLDGRTRAAQHVRDTRQEVMTDLGGADHLSTLERSAVDHVSLLDAMTKDAGARWLKGDPIDVASIATLVNAFNRTAAVLGWQRRARDITPDLSAYVRDRQPKEAANG